MSTERGPAPEHSNPGRGLRKIFSSIVSLFADWRNNIADGPAAAGGSGHLGRQRAIRLSAILAPRNRRKAGAAGLVVIIAAAAVFSAMVIRDEEQLPRNNAIWLDRSWVYGDLDDGRLNDLAGRMAENRIGSVYAYVSSLGVNNRWSGDPRGDISFMDSRDNVREFASALKGKSDQIELLAWIEIWTHLDTTDGYRLDEEDLHQNIADFCRLLIEQLGFDGVLLDVKPMFTGNNDFIRLIRRVRSALGVETPIAVAVTADLTPPDQRLKDVPLIAPGTMWSADFKKRVMVSADEVVLLMYQSYRQERQDYVNWVAYHVQTYVDLLETATDVIVSIPNYGGASSAHKPEIETMAAALDGVKKGLGRLDEDARPLLTGVAIYSDAPLGESDWTVFREQWLQR